MSRTLLLLALFLLLGGGAYWVWAQKGNKKSSSDSWDMQFSIPNTEIIEKIFIADRMGHANTLEKINGVWMVNGKYRARPSAINTVLETLQKQTVAYFSPEAAEKNMVSSLATEGLKVEVYAKGGEKIKAFYIGGVTNDERGTFMILENSNKPYVVHVPGFIGQLRVRFFTDETDWRDRMVFSEKPEDIKSVTVDYPLQKSESFRIDKIQQLDYSVKPFYPTTPVIHSEQRKGVVESYLLLFEKLAAESYENEYSSRDSIVTLVPFAIITVNKSDGTEKKVALWPYEQRLAYDGKSTLTDRYFAGCSWGDFMLVQHQNFGPLLRGYDYFFDTKSPKKQF